MPNDFLNSNKLVTLDELRYLLLEVLDLKEPVSWENLGRVCKEKSLNFAFAFENTLDFLSRISLIKIQDDKSVIRNATENFSLLKTDEDLAAFVLQKTILYLETQNIYKKIINNETLTVDPSNNTLIIQTNKIPAEFPFIKALFLNLHIGKLGKESNNQVIIFQQYQDLFSKKSGSSKLIAEKRTRFFISYAHKDETYKEELIKHCSGLIRNGIMEDWDGRQILPGEDWDEEIKQKLEEADVILFLVSSDFMASNYINDVEIKKAIERYKSKQVKIIPVIIRACDFESLPISKHLAVPKDGRAISSWPNKDEAYLDVVNQIKKIL